MPKPPSPIRSTISNSCRRVPAERALAPSEDSAPSGIAGAATVRSSCDGCDMPRQGQLMSEVVFSKFSLPPDPQRVHSAAAALLPCGRKMRAKLLIAGVLACSSAAPPFAAAAPNEIRVFTDELARYREHTLEIHVNQASSAGSKVEDRSAPLQIMPEYSYGILRNWELSFQLPFAVDQSSSGLDGYR